MLVGLSGIGVVVGIAVSIVPVWLPWLVLVLLLVLLVFWCVVVVRDGVAHVGSVVGVIGCGVDSVTSVGVLVLLLGCVDDDGSCMWFLLSSLWLWLLCSVIVCVVLVVWVFGGLFVRGGRLLVVSCRVFVCVRVCCRAGWCVCVYV